MERIGVDGTGRGKGARGVRGVLAAASLCFAPVGLIGCGEASADAEQAATREPEARPTGQAVIDRYLAAAGGAERWRELRSMRVRYRVRLAGGLEAAEDSPSDIRVITTISTLAPDFRRTITDVETDDPAAQQMLSRFRATDQVGGAGYSWTEGGFNGGSLLETEQSIVTRIGAVPMPQLIYAELFPTMRVTGDATVEGEACWMLELDDGAGYTQTEWYSKASGLLVQIEASGQTTVFRSWTTVDGLKVPDEVEQRFLQMVSRLSLLSAEPGVALTPADFRPIDRVRGEIKLHAIENGRTLPAEW